MASTCFGLRPLSGSLQLSLAKVILILKHSVKLRRNLLCGGVAACCHTTRASARGLNVGRYPSQPVSVL